MTPEAIKRQFVSDLYSGAKWKQRVEKMTDAQITAIYLDHQKDTGTQKSPEPEPPQEFPLVDIPVVADSDEPAQESFLPHQNEDDFPLY